MNAMSGSSSTARMRASRTAGAGHAEGCATTTPTATSVAAGSVTTNRAPPSSAFSPASDPPKCLSDACAASETFDLVLCDVGLPGGRSGLDVCYALRDSGFRGKLVLMTGWDGGAVNADGRASSCDTILGKPFMGEELLQVIDSLLEA